MLNRFQAPEVFPIDSSVDIHKADIYQLTNGIALHKMLSGSQEALRVEWIFKGGNWNQSKAGTSYFASKLLASGTQQFSSIEIEEKIASLGAHLELESSYERNTITLYILSKHLNKILPLMMELISKAIFPEEELVNLKRTTKNNIEVNEQKNSYLASNQFRASIFGFDHPYGRFLNKETIDAIDRQDIIQFYQNTFHSSNCEIFVSGNTTLDLNQIFQSTFGLEYWGNSSSEQNRATHTLEYKVSKTLISKPQSLQSSIRIGKPTINIQHRDYIQLSVLVEILGGYFGSRLMKNIREEKGYTYGISSSLVSLTESGYLVIGTDVNVDNTQNTIDEVYKEIARLQTEPVSEDELNQVKNYLVGSFQSSLNSPFALCDKYKNIYFNTLQPDFYQQYIHTLLNTDSNSIQQLANQYFKLDSFTEIVAGVK